MNPIESALFVSVIRDATILISVQLSVVNVLLFLIYLRLGQRSR